jgi:nicotinamide mononucleotide transporter
MPIDIYELIGFISGVICVYLVVKQNIWNWPVALVNAFFYILVFYQARLYADMGLQGIYIILSLYGWYEWLHGGQNNSPLTVSRIRHTEGLTLGVIAVCSTFGLGYLLHAYTNADLPYWDALTTVMSLCAQFLMARKKIENWIIWISVDIIYIGMYYYKALYLTMVLYAVFLVLATMGYFAWRKSLHNPKPA